MKKPIFNSIIVLLLLFSIGCTDQSLRSGSVEGSFFSIDTLSLSQINQLKSRIYDWTGSGWRGERISCQVVLEASEVSRALNIQVLDFSGPDNRQIAAGQIKVFSIKTVMTDVFAEGCDKTGIEIYDSSLVADILEPLDSTFELDSGEIEIIWLTIDIPSGAEPGTYTTEISVSESGSRTADFRIELEVLPHELPPPSEWSFHLDLWQNPYAVARYYNVEPWSEDHFKRMRPTMEMLAEAGQKCITATITGKPWAGQTFDPFESMIEKVRKSDGSWQYDYSAFDAWIEFAISCGIDKQINCYSMVSWSNEYNYFDEGLGVEVNLLCKPGSSSYNALWIPFLNDFNAHLIQKNWHTKTTISMDERSMEDLMEVIKLIDKEAPGLKIAFAGRYHPELDEELYDLSVASKHIVPEENLTSRKANDYKTTFYVCCVEERPNTFTFSGPSEASYLPWFAANRGFDGMLRWSFNSWTKDPVKDSRFRRFPAGDTYIVYPGGLSSVRFERLREGIQDFEKIKILEKSLLAEGTTDSGAKLSLLKNQLSLFDIEGLKEHSASETLREGKMILYQLSK